jgi:hypothetical protein
MDSYDKIEELLLAEGYSKEEIPSIMVSLVEQGIDPLQVFASGLGNMLFNKTKTQVKPKMTTTQQSGGMLGQRTIPTPGNGLPRQAPKPEFGPGAVRTPTGTPTPSLRPGGQTPIPKFGTPPGLKPPTPTPPARNNLSLQRTPQIKAPSLPSAVTSTASRGAGLFNRLKSIKPGSPLKMGLSLVAGGLIDKGVERLGELGGKQIAKGIVSATGNQDRFPSLYDKQGPNLSIPIVKGIRARDAAASKNAVYGQRTNEYGQKSSVPSSGDPSTFAKGKTTDTPVELASKLPALKPPAPKPPTAQERAYGSRSKLTADQQAMNQKYDKLRGLKGGRVTTPNSPTLNSFLAKRGLK